MQFAQKTRGTNLGGNTSRGPKDEFSESHSVPCMKRPKTGIRNGNAGQAKSSANRPNNDTTMTQSSSGALNIHTRAFNQRRIDHNQLTASVVGPQQARNNNDLQ